MEPTVRVAARSDVRAIVEMLADDHLGRTRESLTDPLPETYYTAFEAIDSDPNHELLVAELDGRVIGTLQITYTPSLSHQGSWRATVESVRTVAELRGKGIGALMMRDAVERAKARGCKLVQLSTDKSRTDAQRFYERLGFVKSHEGMKLKL
ncbi:MAG TPA: GNAT family N-acetyltransferase [Longimicrobiales bacterium]|nr:GNAT family N-acetyltransferase [Longimicrobiales bacterium]